MIKRAWSLLDATWSDKLWRAPILVLALSLIATIAVLRHQTQHATALGQQRFEQTVQLITTEITEALAAHAQVLRGGAGVFHASDRVSRDAWARYVRALDLASSYPGIQGVGHATVLRGRAEVTEHERQVRMDGLAGYTVRPPGERDLITSIVLIEPLDWRNQRALGFDMYSETVRRAAMDRAIETGQPSLSGKVTLVQEVDDGPPGEVQAGVLMYLPLYREGARTTLPAERRAALTGFVYSPFRMRDLIQGISFRGSQGTEQWARIEIYDGAATTDRAAQLYEGPAAQSKPATPRFAHVATLDLFGRHWTIRAVSTPAFEAQSAHVTPMMLLLAGLGISGLLSAFAWSMARREQEAKRSEQELRLAVQRTDIALAAGSTGTWLLDLDTGAVDFDERARAIWGLPKGSSISQRELETMIVLEDQPGRRAALDRALAPGGDGRYEAEYRIAAQGDRALRWVVVRGQVEHIDGRPDRVSGTVRDITERKTAEQQLAHTQARLAGIVDNATDAILSIDGEQRITLFNWGAEKIFGYTASEVIGKPLDLLIPQRSHSAHARHIEEFGRSVEVSRKMGERSEIFGVRKDGTEFPAEASISRLDLPTGPVFTAILRDVSETKLAAQRLETTVAERTQELRKEIHRREEAQAALSRSQRMEAFGQLAGGVAHDFNNLLTVITGNQELLEMRLKDEKNLTLLKRSQEAAEMGARLTARLLTFARRRQLEPSVLNLNEQISGMVELLRRSIGEQVTLTTNLAPRVWAVRADPSEIENAVLNLAINARDAMPNGGALVIETADFSIDDGDPGGQLRLPAGDYVRISVSDTGAGMAPEVIARAFEPFFTTKPPGKGTGLGLSTIYGFVQQSGGTVTVYSEVGRGTTINIYLPRAPEDRTAARSERSNQVPVALTGEAILLVEDRPDVRDVTRARLEQLGYHVIEADSGVAAIEFLQSGKSNVQLVFSDVVMPGGVSGYDLARWVQANRPALKMLLTSGFSEQVAGARDPDHATVKLLRKPYTRIDLARAVRDALDR